jgi:hypothetical protein
MLTSRFTRGKQTMEQKNIFLIVVVTFIRIDIFARNVQQLQGYDVLVTRTKA